mmetsp:Transcript_64032/g.206275  ORF Transcript_64032/g.206275 Transcript_64032/m.206275 type:complete len:284 (+) Transcript_64032:105-956(+)
MFRVVFALALGSLARVGCADAAPPTPTFSADRYPTGAQECSWLNWIADRSEQDDLQLVKENIIARTMSLGIERWEAIGNGVLGQHVFDEFAKYIRGMNCTRNATLIANCVGITDIACRFKNFTADDTSVIFRKTDGGVACPSSHQVIEENDQIRVINVHTPPGRHEVAFHTHTRLSFWIYYGVSRGERYWRYDGTLAFDDPVWDRKSAPQLRIMWNGPEWFHLTQMKETEPYLQGQAPGNCPASLAPNCTNGFKYRVELKLGAEPEAKAAALPPRPQLLRGSR